MNAEFEVKKKKKSCVPEMKTIFFQEKNKIYGKQ